MASAGRIDTHHHVVPRTYAAWLRKKGIEAGGLPIPDWSLDAAISIMDKFRIQTSIMSISTPGVHLGDDAEAREKAREVNEYAAEVDGSIPLVSDSSPRSACPMLRFDGGARLRFRPTARRWRRASRQQPRNLSRRECL